MFNKIVVFLLKKFVFPLLQIILVRVLDEFVSWIIDKMKEIISKFRKRDEDAATSAEDREHIQKKYEQMEAEFDHLKSEISAKLPEIVKTSLKEADEHSGILLRDSSKTPALKEMERELQRAEHPSADESEGKIAKPKP
jgi:hypothetical protein